MYSNLVDLCAIIEATRQNGKTSILAGAVKEADGVLVVHSQDFGKQLQKKYPKILYGMPHNVDSLRGISKPIFIDHYCLYKMVVAMKNVYELEIEKQKKTYEQKIYDLEKKLQFETSEWEKNQKYISHLHEEATRLCETIENLKNGKTDE